MRYLAFEQTIEIPDFEHLIRTRLSQAIVIWPEQALSLIGYMAGRTTLKRALKPSRSCEAGQWAPKACRGDYDRLSSIGRASRIFSAYITIWKWATISVVAEA
jgi:hypothetical protein